MTRGGDVGGGGPGGPIWMVKSDNLWVQLKTNSGGWILQAAVKQQDNVLAFDPSFKQLFYNGKKFPMDSFKREGMNLELDTPGREELLSLRAKLGPAGKNFGNRISRNKNMWTLQLLNGAKLHFNFNPAKMYTKE